MRLDQADPLREPRRRALESGVVRLGDGEMGSLAAFLPALHARETERRS